MDDLELKIVLVRHGPPGSEWTAELDRGEGAEPVGGLGPMPGPLLEELGADLDEAELAAIAATRAL